jgi:hypothetical protein
VEVPFYLLAFYQKNTCPTQVWGRCNEEETVREKERKERKVNEDKRKEERDQDKKQKNGSGETDMRDIYPCGCCGCCLFICNQMVGVGLCLVQLSESLRSSLG